MFGAEGNFDHFAERDRACEKLKQRLHLARCARNKPEERRLEKQLKWWGVPV